MQTGVKSAGCENRIPFIFKSRHQRGEQTYSSQDRLTPLPLLPLMERIEVAHGCLHLEVGDDVAKSETAVRRAFGIQRPFDVAMSQSESENITFWISAAYRVAITYMSVRARDTEEEFG